VLQLVAAGRPRVEALPLAAARLELARLERVPLGWLRQEWVRQEWVRQEWRWPMTPTAAPRVRPEQLRAEAAGPRVARLGCQRLERVRLGWQRPARAASDEWFRREHATIGRTT
jgi:hypothetical protein